MTQPRRPKIGLLALTLELYESLAPSLRPGREAWLRARVLPLLTQHAEVLFERAVYRQADVQATIASYEAAQADAILVLLLTYAPSQWTLPALGQTRLPIAIWNTQECVSVNQNFTVETMIDNHGVHGTQDLANLLTRLDVPFLYVTSPPTDPAGLEQLTDFFAAAHAVRRLRTARIGALGHPFPGMGDIAVDTTQLAATLGCACLHLSLEEFFQRSAGAGSDQTSRLIQSYRDTYAVAPHVTEADLEATARSELALRSMVAEHHLDALTCQFLAFGEDERAATLPFVAVSRLMADGIGFGGEGDLIGALGNTLLDWLAPPASFTEMFTIDFAGGSILMSHMGEANVAMARRDRPVPLVARPTPITRTRHRQLALLTSFEPGPATFAALTLGSRGRWRVITASVTIDDFGPLPGFCVPHFKMRPGLEVGTFLTAYAQAGGPHHNAICFGDARRRLEFVARLLGADFCDIG